ncbi:MAG: hypothetical protein M1818_007593 [Claussenomyces sp. TS43310]|nr:MAG: hypothetical protein M1818_007593 [Claussenomyces sp. TS43310]
MADTINPPPQQQQDFPPVVPNLTRYGRLYGTNLESELIEHLRGTGRSGLTPASVNYREGSLSAVQRAQMQQEIIYQRSANSGWTSEELYRLGAIEQPNVKPNNLSNPIHPTLSRSRWEAESALPLGDGLPGTWCAANPVVWNVMKPILRLATNWIMTTELYPWFDALINGPLEWVESPPAPEPFTLARFRLRPVQERKRTDTTIHEHLVNIQTRFHLTFVRGLPFSTVSSANLADEEVISFHGVTLNDGLRPVHMRIGLAYENVEPLLKQEISGSQKLITQFQNAKTIVHELCHVMDLLRSRQNSHFHNEMQAEVGKSFENVMFGGWVDFLPKRPAGWGKRNVLAEVTHTWPSVFTWQDQRSWQRASAIPINYVSRVSTSWPIPLSHIENLQQQEYWDHHVEAYGTASLHPYPRLFAIRQAVPPNSRAYVQTCLLGPDYDKYRFSLDRADDDEVRVLPGDTRARRMEVARILAGRRQAAYLNVRRQAHGAAKKRTDIVRDRRQDVVRDQ